MKIENIGKSTIRTTISLGECFCLVFKIIFGKSKFRSIIEQTFSIGVNSILIIFISGLFIGFVISLQGYYTLSKFSAESALGPLVALSIIRELGPVVTALLFAGRAGSALTSEIGLMKATEQISSLKMMGVNPVSFLLTPRFWACLISMPILNLIFCTVAIYGGYLIGVEILGLYSGTFWDGMQSSVLFNVDILNGVLKSFIFGLIVASVSLYQGYYCKANSLGIAQSTTKTVVYSSLLILFMDFILTALMFKGM